MNIFILYTQRMIRERESLDCDLFLEKVLLGINEHGHFHLRENIFKTSDTSYLKDLKYVYEIVTRICVY